MEILFWIVLIIYIIISMINFCKKKFFSSTTFIFIGMVIPLIMYFFKWSGYIVEEPCFDFYYVFFVFFTFAIFSGCIFGKNDKNYFDCIEIKNEKYITFFTYAYIGLYLVENYLGSGTAFPALMKIDIHTYSAAIISFITRSLYPFLFFNVFIFIKKIEKKYLFNTALLILVPVITRSARIVVFIACFQIFAFILYYIWCKREYIDAKVIKKIKKSILVIAIVGVLGMTALTNIRMNKYGKYSLSYSEEILYTGPDIFKDIMSVYYGYFPMSFNNLNHNIKNLEMKHNYIGLYTFVDLYYGFFQLDNLLGINSYKASEEALIITYAATVRTAFYEYYYDFGVLCIIPILLMFIIQAVITKKSSQKQSNIFWNAMYFFYTPLMIFLSFQNLFFGAVNYWTIIIIYIFSKFFIKSERDEISHRG